MTVRHPPGRAGRSWLEERLGRARHGVALLQRKRDVLRREELRLETLHERTGAEWERCCREAERWMVRALVLGGREALGRARLDGSTTTAAVRWESSMGVTYPGEVVTSLGPPPSVSGPAALGPATDAYRAATEAAVQHAASVAALSRVRAELTSTSRRLRGIRDRFVPQLEETLRALDLQLEEIEREEITRRRWVPVGSTGASRTDDGGDR
ncbi:MAG: V-type ATP synthase subunit D [Acidimicrobiales bacterium]